MADEDVQRVGARSAGVQPHHVQRDAHVVQTVRPELVALSGQVKVRPRHDGSVIDGSWPRTPRLADALADPISIDRPFSPHGPAYSRAGCERSLAAVDG